MKCIVTAGPTYEELDEVRRMTNFSTGALGSELANALVAKGHDVILLRGHYATCRIEPATKHLQVFSTTADLCEKLEALASTRIGAVFHAAAVSDFTFGKIWRSAGGGKMREVKSRKISTRRGALLAELAPTPKIIARLRGWFPNAWVVGWKYELEGDRIDLLHAAGRQMKENSTDACVVNGAAYGKGYGLVTAPDVCQHLATQPELFKALAIGLSKKD